VYGTLFTEAWHTKALLEDQGVSVRLVNLRTVQPLDEKAVMEAAEGSRLLVTIEDHFVTGGLLSCVAEVFLRHRFTGNVLPMAMDHSWFQPSSLAEVLQYEGFSPEKIAEKILNRLNVI